MKYIIFLLSFIPLVCLSQKKVQYQNLNFFRYQLNVSFSKNYSLKSEIENRSYFFAGRQNQFIVKSAVEKKINNLNYFGIGAVYSKATSPQDPEAIVNNITFEFRPFFYYQYDLLNKKKSLLLARLTTDFRYFEHTGSCFQYGTLRPRILIEYHHALTNKLIIKTYDEVLFNILGRNHVSFFDQQRFSFGAQYNLSKKISFEIVYQNWYQKQNDGINYLDKNIIKTTFQHRISF